MADNCLTGQTSRGDIFPSHLRRTSGKACRPTHNKLLFCESLKIQYIHFCVEIVHIIVASEKGSKLVPGQFPQPDPKAPEPVDIHVGGVLRTRRMALGMSRDHLAEALEVTAQQIKNYETAASRISASKLFLAAKALDVRVSYFFAEIDEREIGPHIAHLPDSVAKFLDSPEGVELASVFPKISDTSVRKQFIGLAKAISQTQSSPDRPQTGAVA